VFHTFREVGNAFIIFHLFEEMLHLEEVQDLAYAKPFQGEIPVFAREGMVYGGCCHLSCPPAQSG
jgi:cytoplasmic FMR1 interacting protein